MTESRHQLAEMVEFAETYPGGTAYEAQRAGFFLENDERTYAVFRGASLIEVMEGDGHFEMGSTGFGYQLTDRASISTGKTQGRYVRGESAPTELDTGDLAFTDKRVTFKDPAQGRQWHYANLIGITHDDENCWTAISVSDREKASGFAYSPESLRDVRFRLALSIAAYQGSRPDFVRDLRSQLQAMDDHLGLGS